MSATAREEIVDKKGKVTSPVRQYFGYFKSDKSQTGARSLFLSSLAIRQIYFTTSRHSHLLEYSSVQQQQPSTSAATGGAPRKWQRTTMERYSAAVPYDKTSKRYKEITDAAAYHLVKDLLRLRTVEKSGYKNLVRVLDPRYILISNRLKECISNYWYRLIWNTYIVIHFSAISPSPAMACTVSVVCWDVNSKHFTLATGYMALICDVVLFSVVVILLFLLM